MATPNDYTLHGGNIQVGYQTFVQGPPHLGGPTPPIVTYKDPTHSLTFSGTQVQVVNTEVGQIVSVVIAKEEAIQGGDITITMSTTFSFLIPEIVLPDNSAPVHTVGVTTTFRLANSGQLQKYSTVALTGTAVDKAIIALSPSA
jgi:hypothetical protein